MPSHRLTIALAAGAAACAADAPGAPAAGLRHFQVTNALVAPVTVSVDGVRAVILSGGASSGLGVPSTARLLTWTSAKPTDAAGRQIPDDVGEVRVPLAGIGATLEITNLIEGQPHITAGVVNRAAIPTVIGVFDGTAVSCAGALPAVSAAGGRGFVQIGYYRLGPLTEVRAYRDGSGCAGPYVAWPRAAITAFTAKAGTLALSLDTAP